MTHVDTTFERLLSPVEAAAYDAFVDDARGGAYAQTRAWAPAALAGRSFRSRWFLARRGTKIIGAAHVLRARVAAGIVPVPVAIVERGPVVDALEDLPDVLAALRRVLLARGVIRLQVMPYWADGDADICEGVLENARFRSVQSFDGAHARTLRVDLAGKDEASLFAGKSGESLRRKLRQAEKAGATARQGTRADVAVLARLYAELMGGQGRSGKVPAYWNAIEGLVTESHRGAIFVCEHEGHAVSALYASRHGRLATFVIGASTGAEKSFSKMVPSMAAAIRWALAEGCEAFDMGGIPLEDDPDTKRKSIAQFKLDFAKVPVRLVGEHARWLIGPRRS